MKIKEEIKVVGQVTLGRYTGVEVEAEDGIRGVGLSRRAQGDQDRPEAGFNKAKARAYKAILKKRSKKKLNDPLMG